MNENEIMHRINELTTHTPDCIAPCNDNYPTSPPYPTDDHERACYALQTLLFILPANLRPTSDDIDDTPPHIFDELTQLLDALIALPFARDALSHLALDNSLCPLHFHDFAHMLRR